MGNCHPSRATVYLGFVSVNSGFLGETISNVTLSCSKFLYNDLLMNAFIGQMKIKNSNLRQKNIVHILYAVISIVAKFASTQTRHSHVVTLRHISLLSP